MPYSAPEYIDLDDLTRRFPRVVEYLNDELSNTTADPDITQCVIQEASAYADSFLLGSFSKLTIDALKVDPRFIGAVCDIAIGLAIERRGEFLQGGVSPGDVRFKRGKESLKQLGLGYERMGKESDLTVQNEALVYPQAVSEPPVGWGGWL